MAQTHSFDIVSKVDLQEVQNAVNQATKEMRQRFDRFGNRLEQAGGEFEKIKEAELITSELLEERTI